MVTRSIVAASTINGVYMAYDKVEGTTHNSKAGQNGLLRIQLSGAANARPAMVGIIIALAINKTICLQLRKSIDAWFKWRSDSR